MADTHMFHRDWRSVPDGDVLVHAGDLTRGGSVDELLEVRDFLGALPHKHKVIVAGNHDWLFQREPAKARALFDEGFTYLEDAGAVVAGLKLWGSPWTPRYYRWAFMKERGDELASVWSHIPAGLDVLITHGPPHGILDDANHYRPQSPKAELFDALGDPEANPVGCEALRARVREVRPRVHLFGHIHTNQGVVVEDGTKFVNCTTDECERAPVVLDL